MKNRIHVLRAEHRWTQAELAERLNVSRQTINAIETGKYDPSLQLAFALGELFGKSLEEIFQRETNEESEPAHSPIGRDTDQARTL